MTITLVPAWWWLFVLASAGIVVWAGRPVLGDALGMGAFFKAFVFAPVGLLTLWLGYFAGRFFLG